MMSLLKIIDNPINDIAIVTVLRSMIGGFDDNELILDIRIQCLLVKRNIANYRELSKLKEIIKPK